MKKKKKKRRWRNEREVEEKRTRRLAPSRRTHVNGKKKSRMPHMMTLNFWAHLLCVHVGVPGKLKSTCIIIIILIILIICSHFGSIHFGSKKFAENSEMTWQRESQPAWSVKEWQSWRSGEWSEWSCGYCSTSKWSGREKCLSCGVKKSYLEALEIPQRQLCQSKSAWTRPLNSGSQTSATTPIEGRGLTISKQLQNIASLLQSTQDNGPATQHTACMEPTEAVSVHKQINKVEAALESMDPKDLPSHSREPTWCNSCRN